MKRNKTKRNETKRIRNENETKKEVIRAHVQIFDKLLLAPIRACLLDATCASDGGVEVLVQVPLALLLAHVRAPIGRLVQNGQPTVSVDRRDVSECCSHSIRRKAITCALNREKRNYVNEVLIALRTMSRSRVATPSSLRSRRPCLRAAARRPTRAR
jgi:hypothetical protein